VCSSWLRRHADKLDCIIASLLPALIDNSCVERLADLLARMKTFEQRKYLNAILAFLVKQYFSAEVLNNEDSPVSPSKTVSAAASLIHLLTKDNDVLKEHLVSSLTRSSIPMLDDSLSARRSIMAALGKDEG
jgi:telomere length regulation protein